MSDTSAESFVAWCEQQTLNGEMASVDLGLVRLMDRYLHNADPAEKLLALLLVAVLSQARREGHVLIDLGEVVDHPLVAARMGSLPPHARWPEILSALPCVTRPGGETAPFVLVEGSLYFFVLYQEESLIVREVRERLLAPDRLISGEERDILAREARGDQGLASVLERALSRPLFLLTGGPGTGKTWTSSRILAALKKIHPGRVAVVGTPTGKAAQRFRESMSLPDIEVQTLHRLLGMNRRGFAYGPERPLPYDLILVDECSMVDLSLMAQLLRSVTPETSIVLVGDKNQLSSVGPGSVFGDLADAIESMSRFSPDIQRSFHLLTTNFRQDRWEEFRFLAEGIRCGKGEEVLAFLSGKKGGEGPIVWIEPETGSVREVGKRLIEGWTPVVRAGSLAEARTQLGMFALLGPYREGVWGTENLNRLLWRHFENASTDAPLFFPVIVTENSYETGLMNGDVGLLEIIDRKVVNAFFPESGGESVRQISPSLMPPWEGAFALTIHKSQGSEFDHVFVLLGNEPHQLLSRPLFYTAVTRARQRLTVYGSGNVIRETVEKAGGRSTGLGVRLQRPE